MLRRWMTPLSLERRSEVMQQLSVAASPQFDFFLLVFLSCSIATFGLITDSAAVIIGAMLIAPLMSPIIGLSLASVAGESYIFRRAMIALVEGAVLAVVLSWLLGWISSELPFGILIEIPNEVLARTHPSPFDLGIALAGGAAAAYALAQPHLSAALPGVAIATALMPPLCTMGIGLSLKEPEITLGALLLFLTNFAAISFAGIIVFAALGFRPNLAHRGNSLSRSLLTSAALVLAVTVPLVVLSMRFVGETNLRRQIRSVVENEIARLPDTHLVDIRSANEGNDLALQVTLRSSRQPSYQQVVSLQETIATQLQRTVSLQLIVVPSTRLDPLVPPTFTPTFTPGPTATSSRTPTPNPTSTPQPTQTATPTITPTTTETPTPTPTFTPTPVIAFIANTSGSGVYLRDAPNGQIISGALPEGAPVQILYQRETVNRVDWLEVRDALGRSGWVKAILLVIRP